MRESRCRQSHTAGLVKGNWWQPRPMTINPWENGGKSQGKEKSF